MRQFVARGFALLLVVILALFALSSCASSPKARYYENLDMYTFVMDQFRVSYDASTPEEQAKMDKDVLPLLDKWWDATQAWKAALNDPTKERAAMLAWASAKSILLEFGVIKAEEVQ